MSINAVHHKLLGAAVLSAIVLAACKGKSSRYGGETASAGGNVMMPESTRMGAMADTSRMKGYGMGGPMMNRTAPRDSNEAFLRMMSDHHQGLLMMTSTAMPKLGPTAKSDAEKLRSEQTAEQQKMLRMLMTQYKDSITPTVMPSCQQMISAVANASGTNVDHTFYQQVIAHHEQGVQMTERMLPNLTGETRQMATKSVAEQKKEIAEFQKKMSAMH